MGWDAVITPYNLVIGLACPHLSANLPSPDINLFWIYVIQPPLNAWNQHFCLFKLSFCVWLNGAQLFKEGWWFSLCDLLSRQEGKVVSWTMRLSFFSWFKMLIIKLLSFFLFFFFTFNKRWKHWDELRDPSVASCYSWMEKIIFFGDNETFVSFL